VTLACKQLPKVAESHSIRSDIAFTGRSINDTLEIFGAIKIDSTTDVTGLSFLEEAGLKADAELLFGLNSSDERKDVVLQLPGRPEEIIVLDPATVLLEGEGSLRFQNDVFGFAGADIGFDGAFSARIKVDLADDPSDPDPTRRGDNGVDLDLFLAGRLEVNLVAFDQQLDFLTLDALGMVAVRDVGAVVDGDVLVPQAAGRVDLFVERSLRDIIELQGSAQLLFNTLGQEFVYLIPDRLQDRLKAIRARRQNVSPGDVTLPDLPAVIDPLTGDELLAVTVPDRPPELLDGEQFAPGPYFVLQLGDIDETTPPSGNPDPDGDRIMVGVANQSDINVDLDEAARGGFELAISANVSLAAPGAEELLNTEASGLLRITKEELVGAIGLQSAFDIPGVNLNADVEAFVGINTTTRAASLQFQNANLPDREILPQSTEIYVGGTLEMGGFDLEGSFRMLVSSQALQLEVDAYVGFFDVEAAHATGTAAIYYNQPSGQNGLVLDAVLTVGESDKLFGIPHVLEVGGTLRLYLDTRAASTQLEIQIADATVEVLEVLDLEGSASIAAGREGGESFFTLAGAFEASLFDSEIAGLSAEGSFDSRGTFSINVFGGIMLGTEDWGIQGGVDIAIDKQSTENNCIDLSGSGFGRIRAFGTTLFGVNLKVEYFGTGDGAIVRFRRTGIAATTGARNLVYRRPSGLQSGGESRIGTHGRR
jgi:hypothetical protein